MDRAVNGARDSAVKTRDPQQAFGGPILRTMGVLGVLHRVV